MTLTSRSGAQVVFLIPYFGPLPAYAELFFRSCQFNQSIDVILFLDRESRFEMPHNVYSFSLGRDQLVERISTRLGLDIGKIGGHKLCDFKPHYGLIFQEFIFDYSWWGFCDLDMMFGDVDRWVAEVLGEGANIYTAHDRIIAGHFTVVKNETHVNQAIADMIHRPGLRVQFEHPTCQMLDEYPFLEHVRSHPRLMLHMAGSLSSCLCKDFVPYGITFGFDGAVAELPSREFGVAVWHRGRVWYEDSNHASCEVLYLHFMGTKRWWHWLFFRQASLSLDHHVFSALGYGGIDGPRQLGTWRYKAILFLQATAELFRQFAGRLLRGSLGVDSFRWIRRIVISQNRY